MAKKSLHDLPKDVIMEILLRLPVKFVLRCKCVCKSWLSLISHPYFATSHFQLAASPTHKLLFIEFGDPQTPISIDFHATLDDDSASSLSLDFFHPGSLPEIGGSCRGFLFLHTSRDFYLWNPSTGVHKQIPTSLTTIATIYNGNTFKLLYGFGYDMSSDDYMVVLGSYKYNPTYPPISSSIHFEIFSLRANKWKQIEGDSHLPYIINDDGGAKVGSFLNGSIHWLVHNNETKKNVIIAFDLKESRMSEIALPDAFHECYTYPMEYDLLVYGGLISAWIVDTDMETIKLWVMQEYSVHSSWTKTLVFSLNYVWHFAFTPICSTNSGDIVGSDGLSGFAKFNDKGQLLEHHTYYSTNELSTRFQKAVYTESLLSLPSGGIEQD